MMTPRFGQKFWKFGREAGYRPERHKTTDNEPTKYALYRFVGGKPGYPEMIELLSRHPDVLGSPKWLVIEPLPISDDVSSLSASDLHLEFAENAGYIKHNPLEATGDILILAGDIDYLGDENYSRHPFWDWASENYKQVIVAMGNHKFYKYFDIAKLKDGYKVEIRHNVAAYCNGVLHPEDMDIITSTEPHEFNLNVSTSFNIVTSLRGIM